MLSYEPIFFELSFEVLLYFYSMPGFYFLLFSDTAKVARLPVVLSYRLSFTEATCCAYAFLHVERNPAAASTAYVLDSDFLSERWCTFCHIHHLFFVAYPLFPMVLILCNALIVCKLFVFSF